MWVWGGGCGCRDPCVGVGGGGVVAACCGGVL